MNLDRGVGEATHGLVLSVFAYEEGDEASLYAYELDTGKLRWRVPQVYEPGWVRFAFSYLFLTIFKYFRDLWVIGDVLLCLAYYGFSGSLYYLQAVDIPTGLKMYRESYNGGMMMFDLLPPPTETCLLGLTPLAHQDGPDTVFRFSYLSFQQAEKV